ncbi:bifunctional diguanylate cyclase/phosphodiesterase [Luteimonas vadosa]|uniref:GGDEF domain-containing protein n=1 Tax=Luteimonas vadosa TaxID=1165507 RepID=A0ABP9E5S7_9GAMM
MLNRVDLYERMERARAGGGEASVGGVLVLRMQRLREFEAIFGYAGTERLSQAIDDRLRRALRSVDQMVRIGDCDFVAILPQLHDRQHALLAANKVARVMSEPFEIMGRPARAMVAVGAATWPHDGTDPDTLCLRADEACLHAARQRGRHALYSGSQRCEISHDTLHEAILRNQLQVYLQPIHALHDDALVGFESLARWHDGMDWIPPDLFIPVAEQTGLIDELTQWSINTTLRHCAPVLAANPGLTCSINLSPRAIFEHGIVDQIESSLKIWNVKPSALTVEITETAFIEDADFLSDVLGELHALGVGIAIDDYGTGFSSLGYLRQFPMTELKIDRSFVLDITQNTRSEQLVAAMIDLAHRLDATVVAEGVEDADSLAVLRRLGCDWYQGYYKARPAPADDVLAGIGEQAVAG